MKNLVEWEQIDLRLSGWKLQRLAVEQLSRKPLPVSDLKLEFLDGQIVIAVKVQKGMTIPVRAAVTRITAIGSTVELKIENVSTFGVLPVPKVLFRFMGEMKLPEGIRFDTESMKVRVELKKLLPPFVNITVAAVRMVEGGLVVRLGNGGVDL